MRDLSLHVLDIAQNSIKANADTVYISFDISASGLLTLTVSDDGDGMPEELLTRVTDPFATTRTTRRVGLGIPLIKSSAERAGGSFSMKSDTGVGTELKATFELGNIDCPPMGDISGTLFTLVAMNPDGPEFVFTAASPAGQALFDTREVRSALGDVPLTEPDVLNWIREAVKEEFEPIFGGA